MSAALQRRTWRAYEHATAASTRTELLAGDHSSGMCLRDADVDIMVGAVGDRLAIAHSRETLLYVICKPVRSLVALDPATTHSVGPLSAEVRLDAISGAAIVQFTRAILYTFVEGALRSSYRGAGYSLGSVFGWDEPRRSEERELVRLLSGSERRSWPGLLLAPPIDASAADAGSDGGDALALMDAAEKEALAAMDEAVEEDNRAWRWTRED